MTCDEAPLSPSWGSEELHRTSLFGGAIQYKYIQLAVLQTILLLISTVLSGCVPASP